MTVTSVWDTACHSDIGGRDEQQDRVEVFSRDDAWLLVLADGMGGHEGGALAAQAVIDVARMQFGPATDRKPEQLLFEIAERAHERINGIGAERGIKPHRPACSCTSPKPGPPGLMSETAASTGSRTGAWSAAQSIIPWSN